MTAVLTGSPYESTPWRLSANRDRQETALLDQNGSKLPLCYRSATTMQPSGPAGFDPKLFELVRTADRLCPPSPHKHFVHKLLQLCYEETRAVQSESWYRNLIEKSGCLRRPSARTVSNAVAVLKESKGIAAGATQITVKELRAQYTGMVSLVARIEASVDRLASICDRQLQISQALDRRQQLFADQSQTYQRQIDGLAEIVKTQSAAAREASKAASEIGLQTARALRDIQSSLARPASA